MTPRLAFPAHATAAGGRHPVCAKHQESGADLATCCASARNALRRRYSLASIWRAARSIAFATSLGASAFGGGCLRHRRSQALSQARADHRRELPRARIQCGLRARARSGLRSFAQRDGLARGVGGSAGNGDCMPANFLPGLRAAKVLGCGKHFPGLGEGNLDSHHELPVIEKPLKQLWAEDLLPYRTLRRQLADGDDFSRGVSAGYARSDSGFTFEEYGSPTFCASASVTGI